MKSEHIGKPMEFDMTKFGRVAVLLGGRSAERAISLMSGRAVLSALLSAGVDAFELDLFGESGNEAAIAQLQQQPMNTAFNVLHGGEGENGMVPALLQLLNIPCTGSDMASSSLAMDKVACKRIWSAEGMPTPPFSHLTANSDWNQVVAELGLPLIVKPVGEGSSIGMRRVDKLIDLPGAYQMAAQFDDVIAEQWMHGAEYTVGILLGQALPVIQLQTDREFYDYEAKYHDAGTRYLLPSGLGAEAEIELQNFALKAFETINCSGWGRVDLMCDSEGRAQLLEVNTVPGMTDHSLVPMAAEAAGISFEDLVIRILSSAN